MLKISLTIVIYSLRMQRVSKDDYFKYLIRFPRYVWINSTNLILLDNFFLNSASINFWYLIFKVCNLKIQL